MQKLIPYIDETIFRNKRVLLRVDYNVTLKTDHSVADDFRIRQSLPTIDFLLKNNNILILVSHLGRPEGVVDMRYSLKPVANSIRHLMQKYPVYLVKNINDLATMKLETDSIYLLENIRFYPEEERNDDLFAKNLASFADVYVNDAFGVSHRENASIAAITKFLPSYGGLLLKNELTMIDKAILYPKHPVVAIIGGAKITTKIMLIGKLIEIADTVLIGGGLANTFFKANGYNIGNSICENDELVHARELVRMAKNKKTELILPKDVVLGFPKSQSQGGEVVLLEQIGAHETKAILDIGPETQAIFGSYLARAKTIIWNGPVGYIENPIFRRGTDFIYYAITQNTNVTSVVGGGETIAAIAKKEYVDRITHISTGGGAMLEYIENGTLPGLEALKH